MERLLERLRWVSWLAGTGARGEPEGRPKTGMRGKGRIGVQEMPLSGVVVGGYGVRGRVGAKRRPDSHQQRAVGAKFVRSWCELGFGAHRRCGLGAFQAFWPHEVGISRGFFRQCRNFVGTCRSGARNPPDPPEPERPPGGATEREGEEARKEATGRGDGGDGHYRWVVQGTWSPTWPHRRAWPRGSRHAPHARARGERRSGRPLGPRVRRAPDLRRSRDASPGHRPP